LGSTLQEKRGKEGGKEPQSIRSGGAYHNAVCPQEGEKGGGGRKKGRKYKDLFISPNYFLYPSYWAATAPKKGKKKKKGGNKKKNLSVFKFLSRKTVCPIERDGKKKRKEKGIRSRIPLLLSDHYLKCHRKGRKEREKGGKGKIS